MLYYNSSRGISDFHLFSFDTAALFNPFFDNFVNSFFYCEPWVKGNDVASFFGYARFGKAIIYHGPDTI